MPGFWIVPKVTEASPKGYDVVRPKYFWTSSALQTAPDLVASGFTIALSHFQVDAGDAMIVYSPDSTASDDTFLAAQADCVTVPPLDNLITAGTLAAVKAQLEARGLPAGWVTIGMSYRTVLRVMVGLVQLVQRMTALGQPITLTGNLDRTLGSLSAPIQAAITQACADLAIDTTNIGTGTTVRAALLDVGQQFVAGHSVSLGPL